MLKKLKRRFIFINMLLVFIVLAAVFVAMTYASYNRSHTESKGALFRALDRSASVEPPKFAVGMGGMNPLNGEEQHFDSQPVFTVKLDADGTVVELSANGVAVSDEVLSKAIDDVLSSGDREGKIEPLSLMYLWRVNPDGGSTVAFLDTSAEDAAQRSEILRNVLIGVGALGAFFLISLFLANMALRPVEKAWEQQQQFVADASHELKTPLTVILASLGILSSHKRETIEANYKWIEGAEAESLRMKGLINDMLYLAKSDAEQAPVIFCDTDLSDALWSVLLPFESVAFERKITLTCDIAPEVIYHGNETQLKQLATILVDNACKYCNDSGSVIVSLAKEARGDVLLTVSNTGLPIAKEDMAHIFERFYRADKSRTSGTKGGYGLGLAIAKSIVDAHNGKIGVESDAEAGTVFWVKL